MKKILICLFLFSVYSLISFADNVSDFIEGKGINSDKSSIYVLPLDGAVPMLDVNSSLPLIPASIMKCVTTASLLSNVNEEYRFKTGVYLSGEVVDGILEGNLIVEGSGDPSLNSRHVADCGDICQQIADSLVVAGICGIKGKIIVDQTIWEGPGFPPSWATADLPHAYGTATHGLNFEDNASGSRAVKNPAQLFENRLKAALSLNGIKLCGLQVRDGDETLLFEHESVPLEEIMRSCMMRSDNQYAEALFRTYAVTSGKKGSLEHASKLISKHWKKKKAPIDGVTIVDGSGLSRQNRMTARFMAHVLRSGSSNPYYASFFPLAGQEGTLKRFLAGTPLEGYLALKTGSMNGIQCYAGYKLNDDYEPTHIIVVMLNELKDRAAARGVIEKILLNLFVTEAI